MHIISPVHFGGGESLLINLLKDKKIEHEQVVLTIYKSNKFSEELNNINITEYNCNKKNIGHGVGRLKSLLGSVKSLYCIFYFYHYIKIFKPNIIHCHGYPGNLYISIIKFIISNKIKIIDTRHFYLQKHNIIQQIIFNNIYKKFDKITCVSETVKKSFISNYPLLENKTMTIYNCIGDDFYLNKYTMKKTIEDNKKIFVQIARFSPFKNQQLVLESLLKIDKSRLSDIQVWFIGDGETKNKCIDFVEKNNRIKEHVKFLGFINNIDIPRIINRADFALFPSDLEGFGISAVECMASGLPVVCLKNELMEEIIGNSGILIDRENFHIGMEKMCIMGENLKTKALERSLRFNSNLIKEEYFKLYSSIK